MPILVSFLDGDGTRAAKVDRFPEACPLCHARSAARFIAATNRTASFRQICFQCTSVDCRALFLGTYAEEASATFRLVACEPRRHPKRIFGAALSNISPYFTQIYDEALAAEADGLAQLSRLGMRAALEHLIKDFCKFNNPIEAHAIERMSLTECVEHCVNDANLRTCIGRASQELESRGDSADKAALGELLSLSVELIESELSAK
jgi:hypothetical protein